MFTTIKSLIPEPRQADQPRHYVGRHRQPEPVPARAAVAVIPGPLRPATPGPAAPGQVSPAIPGPVSPVVPGPVSPASPASDADAKPAATPPARVEETSGK
ncbi:hypothetical protein [Couchioplanes azureus]|uniref:hypothetical protein n=1 Tax=Couchioplanes caeruleus TaxID=56438 RepID=UPI0016704D52|nr:hypothetical protein [Couchioplanes caeruleus]GGQ46404.1 hypothetical protein GCM10010166_13800 [Couchioplanes caeruleus subsp. azureus]